MSVLQAVLSYVVTKFVPVIVLDVVSYVSRKLTNIIS